MVGVERVLNCAEDSIERHGSIGGTNEEDYHCSLCAAHHTTSINHTQSTVSTLLQQGTPIISLLSAGVLTI